MIAPMASMEEESSTIDNEDTQNNPAYTRVGVQGVRLKKFEEAVADLLETNVLPNFVELPPTPSSSGEELSPSWPFDCIPPRARVTGDAPGQLKGNRGIRKEAQLRSMLRCVSAMLPLHLAAESSSSSSITTTTTTDDGSRPITIVDFCGGTGHLALPLALLFPQVEVVVVDLKAASLKLLHEKALQCREFSTAPGDDEIGSSLDNEFYQKGAHVTKHEKVKRRCPGISNLYTFHGSIETFPEHFDIGVALHACGEASDVVLRACAAVKANFCVSPCCVGKLHRHRRNPYVYHATSGNVPSIDYPQSAVFCSIVDAPHWDDLCRAADYGELQELRTPRNATRRTAKALLETDRLLYMEQAFGYQTALTRMDPWECSPKNDILLGWRCEGSRVSSPFRSSLSKSDTECNADIDRARRHLLSPSESSGMIDEDHVDWTRQEEESIRVFLTDFVRCNTEQKYIFPTGMASRKRKLIHFVATQMGLAHWCIGKSYAEKTVGVAKIRNQKI